MACHHCGKAWSLLTTHKVQVRDLPYRLNKWSEEYETTPVYYCEGCPLPACRGCGKQVVDYSAPGWAGEKSAHFKFQDGVANIKSLLCIGCHLAHGGERKHPSLVAFEEEERQFYEAGEWVEEGRMA